MPQDPLLVDQIEIDPSQAGTRLISASAGGNLQFEDPSTGGPLTLAQFSGLGTIAGVQVVGQSGSGAQYPSIQAAHDDIPATSSITNPWLILVMPGVYSEDLVIYRDGVFLTGLGGVTIESLLESTPDAVGASSTITIKTDQGTTPLTLEIRNVRITNSHQNLACVRVLGAVSTTLGSGYIKLADCELRANSAGGNRPLWATSVNNIIWERGSCLGSTNVSLALVSECASLTIDGVRGLPALQVDYNTGGALPVTVGSAYRILGCDGVGASSILGVPFASTLTGAGSLRIIGCSDVADLVFGGDRALEVVGSKLGNLTLNDTVAATLISTRKGSVTSGVATSLQESSQRGAEAFAVATSVSVAFVTDQPDSAYNVSLDLDARPSNDETPWVTSKTATGFDINFFSAQTLNVSWTLHRIMGGATN